MNKIESKFSSEFNWIEFANAIVKLAKLSPHKNIKIVKAEETFAEIGIDSLDSMVLVIYMLEIFGVPAEVQKTKNLRSVSEVIDCVLQYGTKYFSTPDDAIKSTKIV